MFFLFITFIFIVWAKLDFLEHSNFYLLKDVRSSIKFANSTLDERLKIVNQSKAGFGISINNRGNAIKKLEDLEKTCHNMTENEFQYSLYSIYADLNDLQQQYVFPGPYSCYRLVIPLEFIRIRAETDDKYNYAVISKVDYYEKFGEGWLDDINIGDVLSSVDGILLQNLEFEHPELFLGNNRDAVIARWIQGITYKSLKNNLLPVRNHVTLGFERNNKAFIQTLDYLVYSTDCSGLSNIFSDVNPKDDFSLYDPFERQEMKMERKVLSYFGADYGYIYLNNFMGNSQEFIPKLKRILSLEMGKTKGLVIDLRNNPGGSVEFASRYYLFLIVVWFSCLHQV